MGRFSQYIGQSWVTFFLWGVVVVLFLGREALGTRLIASITQLNVREEARNCSVARGVARKIVDEYKALKLEMAEQRRRSVTLRQTLETCAKNKGMTQFSEENEVAVAELCPEDYEAWLHPGFSLQISRTELAEAREGLQTLKDYLSWHCPHLPVVKEAKASAPAEPPVPATSMPALMPISERLLAP